MIARVALIAARIRVGRVSRSGGGLARQRNRRDQPQLVAAGRDQGGLQAALGAERGDPDRPGRWRSARRRRPAPARCARRCRHRPAGHCSRAVPAAALAGSGLPGCGWRSAIAPACSGPRALPRCALVAACRSPDVAVRRGRPAERGARSRRRSEPGRGAAVPCCGAGADPARRRRAGRPWPAGRSAGRRGPVPARRGRRGRWACRRRVRRAGGRPSGLVPAAAARPVAALGGSPGRAGSGLPTSARRLAAGVEPCRMPRNRASRPPPPACSAAAACGSRRAKLASSPKTTMVISSEVPPEEIIGSGMPVTGSSPTT